MKEDIKVTALSRVSPRKVRDLSPMSIVVGGFQEGTNESYLLEVTSWLIS